MKAGIYILEIKTEKDICNRDFDYPPGVTEGFRTLFAACANAGNTPFRYFKQYGHEGGLQTH